MIASVIAAVQLVSPDRVSAEPWSLQASLSVTGTFDDNVALAAENEESDLVTTFSPAVRVTRQGERVTFSARYQTNVELYSQRPNFNNISHTGQINLTTLGLGPGFLQRAQFDISEAVTYSKQSGNVQLVGESIGNEGIRTRRTDTWRNSLSATLMLPFTASFSGVVSYTNGIARFKDPTLTDSIEHRLSISLREQLTERTTLNTTYSFRGFDFDGDERQVNHALTAGTISTLTPTLTVGLSAGASYSPDDDRIAPIGSATVTKQLQSVSLSVEASYRQVGNRTALVGSATVTKQFQYTSVGASYRRDVSSAGGGFFQEPVDSQSAGVTLTRAMGERANVNLSGEYRDVRSPTQTGVTRSFSVDAAIDYALTSWLKATAAYRHFAQRLFISESASVTSQPVPDFRNNRVTLAFTGTWGTPRP